MDIKPYERYKTDIAPQEEKKKELENYNDFQKAVLQSLESWTAPKKPVKWFFGKDKDAKLVGLETLMNVYLFLQRIKLLRLHYWMLDSYVEIKKY